MNDGDIAAHDISVGYRLHGATPAAAAIVEVEALEQRQPHVGRA